MIPSYVTPVLVTGTFSPIPGSIFDVNVTQVGGNAVTTTIPVSGTVTADAGTGNFTVVQATGSNLHMVVDSGTVSISGSVAVTGPLTDAELRATPVPVTQGGTGTVTVTRVSVNNTTAVTLSASNSAKQRVVIYNEGGTLFVKFGATASSTDYSYVMTVDSTLEIEGYYGLITARKNSGTTFVQVTEIGI